MLSVEEAAEGVRRMLVFMGTSQVDYLCNTHEAEAAQWSLAQCRSIAKALFAEAGVSLRPGTAKKPGRVGALPGINPSTGLAQIAPQSLPLPLAVALFLQALLTRPALALLGFTSRWIDVAGVGTFHFYEAGGGRDDDEDQLPPLVLLHGMCTTAQCMTLLGLLLARSNRRIIIPDQMGFDFGFSSRKHPFFGVNVTVLQHAAWFEAFLRAMWPPTSDVVRPDLCGHSFGGWLAFMVAKVSPELVGRVILLAPGGLNNFHLGKIVGIVSDPWGYGRRVLSERHGWLEATLIAYATQKLFRTPQSAALLKGWSPEGNRMYHRHRGGLPQRSLLLWGTHDLVQPALGRLLETVPNGSGYWIEGGTHSIIIDAAVTIRELVDSFLLEPTQEAQSSVERRTRLSMFVERAMVVCGAQKRWRPMIPGVGPGQAAEATLAKPTSWAKVASLL